ncbi:MAG: sigma-70 family RNA polymerase sigma factor [Planctomycetota bacterium]
MDPRTASFLRYRDQGDLDALGRLFDAVSPELLRVAMHLTGNAADAEDALQATFVVAMRKAATFEADGTVSAWLSGILTGEANNLRRREGRRRGAGLPDDLVAAAGDEAERRDLVAQLRTHVDALPDEQRQALLLQLQHGLQPAEIAEVVGAAPGTVRMRIHRGLAALRRVLPASVWTLAVAALAPRGLAAVKAKVMAAAAAQAAATATVGAVTFGGLAMKKVLLGICALAAALLVWWAVTPPDDAVAPGGDDAAEVATARGDLDGDDALRHAGGDATAPGAAEAVRDEVGAAVGGARVVVRADRAHVVGPMLTEVVSMAGSGVAMVGVLVEAWQGERGDGPLDGRLLRASTDDDGAVAFDDLAVGVWRFAVYAGGLRLGEPRACTIEGGGRQSVEIHVTLGGEVRGRVVDARGAAVAGAELWVGNRVGDYSRPPHLVRLAARSDQQGRFSLHHAPLEEYVAARKPGFVASESHPVQQLGDGEIVLRLGSAPGAIAGRVTDQDGNPLAGVAVAVQDQVDRLRRDADGTLIGPRLPAIAFSDGDGRFRIDGLPEGLHSCVARQLPDAPANALADVRGGATAQVALVVRRRAALYGYVRGSDGAPRSGLYVWLTYGDGTSMPLLSGADGSFRFEGVEDRPFELAAMRNATREKVSRSFEGRDGLEMRVDLVLDDLPPLRVAVQTSSGRSLVGWVVAVDTSAGVRTAKVRDTGQASLWGVAGSEHTVRLHRDEADVHDAPVATVRATPGQLATLTVPAERLPGALVRGRVVDGQGQPVRDAWGMMPDSPVFEEPGVGADGTFEFVELGAGRHRLRLGAAGRVTLHRDVELQEGQQLDLGDVVLAREATLRIRYRRPDGRPWTARPPMPWLRTGDRYLTTKDVDYAIDGDEVVVTRVPAGVYVVGGPPGDELVIPEAEVSVTAGASRHLTIDVRVGRICALTFAGDGDQTALQVQARLGNGEIVFEQKVAAIEGIYRVPALLPLGRVEVTAVSEAGRRYRLALDVTADRASHRDVGVPHVR